jgi:hypothetical protein
MNKLYKVLTTASILAMLTIPLVASAQDVSPASIDKGQGFVLNKWIAVSGTMGQITDFVNGKSGKFITVTGRGLANTDQSEMILSITKNTKIIDSKGNRVQLKTIIDGDKIVKAFYGSNITKSIPARGTALTLVVQDHHFTGINGTVTEVRPGGIVVKGTDIYTSNEETIVLHFANKTQMLDQNGKVIKAKDIQPGMSVKAFYGPAVSMSIPPQSTTNYVVVNMKAKESVQVDVTGTDGIITNVINNKITVIGNPKDKGGVNYVILTVDENTLIVNQEGKPLTVDALKMDVRVEAYYGEMMMMIYPAQTSASKIIVKAIETNKIEGVIKASNTTNKGQVYVNVGSDSSTDNDVILNITEDTKIIPLLAGETELSEGMKVVAYHSPIMTKSLPGITNAEIVIVTSENNVVAPK